MPTYQVFLYVFAAFFLVAIIYNVACYAARWKHGPAWTVFDLIRDRTWIERAKPGEVGALLAMLHRWYPNDDIVIVHYAPRTIEIRSARNSKGEVYRDTD